MISAVFQEKGLNQRISTMSQNNGEMRIGFVSVPLSSRENPTSAREPGLSGREDKWDLHEVSLSPERGKNCW